MFSKRAISSPFHAYSSKWKLFLGQIGWIVFWWPSFNLSFLSQRRLAPNGLPKSNRPMDNTMLYQRLLRPCGILCGAITYERMPGWYRRRLRKSDTTISSTRKKEKRIQFKSLCKENRKFFKKISAIILGISNSIVLYCMLRALNKKMWIKDMTVWTIRTDAFTSLKDNSATGGFV